MLGSQSLTYSAIIIYSASKWLPSNTRFLSCSFSNKCFIQFQCVSNCNLPTTRIFYFFIIRIIVGNVFVYRFETRTPTRRILQIECTRRTYNLKSGIKFIFWICMKLRHLYLKYYLDCLFTHNTISQFWSPIKPFWR